MCRVGGRRCPGEHDPAVKAARNARRRAKYAADKAAGKIKSKAKKKPSEKSIKPTETSQPIVQHLDIHEKNQLDEKNQLQQPEVEPVVLSNDLNSRRKALGIQTVKTVITGEKPVMEEDNLFLDETLTGVIDYRKLDENSYETFGFTKRESGWMTKEKGKISHPSSDIETKVLSEPEKTAIRTFTEEHYDWVNEMAFHPERIANVPDDGPFEEGWGPYQSADEIFAENPEKKMYLHTKSYNKKTLKAMIEHLDNGLAKGPKKQRVVYRGINVSEMGGGADSYNKTRAWVRENRTVGTEIVFDGYTSTTTMPEKVMSFTPYKNCVMYEIITPEGMAIASVSSFDEQEVLLPRKQRYMVVGVHEGDYDTDYGGYTTTIQIVAINSKGEILDGTNADPIPPMVIE